ncbi:hypothetical protein CEXT_703491 [Caerostris extrusa]|uniref:Uncharacterized protein n=1 Tax=Caerostris extrusa TaxID=172846 RepID=A0AAV4NLS9_CAEEX|nr:hypothetical protein CEXT_703491 [Caerostris extrusa]
MKHVFWSYAVIKNYNAPCKNSKLKGVRLLIVNELTKRQKLNCGFLRAATIGDYCLWKKHVLDQSGRIYVASRNRTRYDDKKIISQSLMFPIKLSCKEWSCARLDQICASV